MVLVFRGNEIEMMPNFAARRSGGKAVVYAKFTTPPKSLPSVRVVSDTNEDFSVDVRRVSPNFFELTVAIPGDDVSGPPALIVKIDSENLKREFTVPVRASGNNFDLR